MDTNNPAEVLSQARNIRAKVAAIGADILGLWELMLNCGIYRDSAHNLAHTWPCGGSTSGRSRPNWHRGV